MNKVTHRSELFTKYHKCGTLYFMTEKKAPGLTLPKREFRFFDKAIKDTYGKGIGEIAQIEPAFAFQAMRTGLTALFTRRGHRQLVQQTETQEGALKTTGVVERELDGETTFTGSMAHAMDGIVDTLITRYENSEADFVISVVRNPSLLGRLRNKEAVTEVVAVIPHATEQ